jgi:hypothetical protein
MWAGPVWLQCLRPSATATVKWCTQSDAGCCNSLFIRNYDGTACIRKLSTPSCFKHATTCVRAAEHPGSKSSTAGRLSNDEATADASLQRLSTNWVNKQIGWLADIIGPSFFSSKCMSRTQFATNRATVHTVHGPWTPVSGVSPECTPRTCAQYAAIDESSWNLLHLTFYMQPMEAM